MSSSKNLEYKKTSFLSKSNSAFIEQMYLKFINRESDLPESWEKYFIEIGEEFEIIAKEINEIVSFLYFHLFLKSLTMVQLTRIVYIKYLNLQLNPFELLNEVKDKY